MRIFISAGEPSGEHHAARLVRELGQRDGGLTFDCMGGPVLAAAGARLLFPLSDFAVLGFAQVFRHLGRFIGVLATFERYLAAERPDAVVLVDYPGLHVRFAALAHRRGIPVIYFVCPQLWAWAPWRARRFARFVDHGLTILPFEEEYFRRRGIDACYVGHPAADGLAETAADGDEAVEAQVRAAGRAVLLLPGSRPQEVAANLPLMLDVAARLHADDPRLAFFVAELGDAAAAACAGPLAAATLQVTLLRLVHPALRAARFALVASGTMTFEVACHGVPMVVVYRVTPLQRRLGSWLLTVPWISQVNLIAGRELVPEFVTAAAPVAEIARASRALIDDTPEREACVHVLREALRPAFAPGATARAAARVLQILGARRPADRPVATTGAPRHTPASPSASGRRGKNSE